jgi:hypothetical protein
MRRRPVSPAFARRSDKKPKTAKRALQRPESSGRVEDSSAALRHPVGNIVDRALRSRKDELLQSHVVHGARGRTDVSRVFGAGKNNCYIFQRHDVNLMQVGPADHYFSGMFPGGKGFLMRPRHKETFSM